jgi:hypothetical protein
MAATLADIDGSPFLPALRKMITALPLNEFDRGILLGAVETCSRHRHNALEVAASHRRPVTPEQRLRRKLAKRAWRARQKAAQL